jgi:hypothetical protein
VWARWLGGSVSTGVTAPVSGFVGLAVGLDLGGAVEVTFAGLRFEQLVNTVGGNSLP